MIFFVFFSILSFGIASTTSLSDKDTNLINQVAEHTDAYLKQIFHVSNSRGVIHSSETTGKDKNLQQEMTDIMVRLNSDSTKAYKATRKEFETIISEKKSIEKTRYRIHFLLGLLDLAKTENLDKKKFLELTKAYPEHPSNFFSLTKSVDFKRMIEDEIAKLAQLDQIWSLENEPKKIASLRLIGFSAWFIESENKLAIIKSVRQIAADFTICDDDDFVSICQEWIPVVVDGFSKKLLISNEIEFFLNNLKKFLSNDIREVLEILRDLIDWCNWDSMRIRHIVDEQLGQIYSLNDVSALETLRKNLDKIQLAEFKRIRTSTSHVLKFIDVANQMKDNGRTRKSLLQFNQQYTKFRSNVCANSSDRSRCVLWLNSAVLACVTGNILVIANSSKCLKKVQETFTAIPNFLPPDELPPFLQNKSIYDIVDSVISPTSSAISSVKLIEEWSKDISDITNRQSTVMVQEIVNKWANKLSEILSNEAAERLLHRRHR